MSKLKDVSGKVISVLKSEKTTGIILLIDENGYLSNSVFVSVLENDKRKEVQELLYAYTAFSNLQKTLENLLTSHSEVSQNEMIELISMIKRGDKQTLNSILSKF